MISCRLKHLYEGHITHKDTGLGNTLFQLATQYGLSKRFLNSMNVYELRVYCEKLKELEYEHGNTIFKKTLSMFDNTKMEDGVLISEERNKAETYDRDIVSYFEKNRNANIKLDGYLQSHLYFDDFRKDIVDLFEIDNESMNYFKNNYSILFDESYTCVSLHVRMNYCRINYNTNFFVKAIQYFKEKYPNVVFLVFSNDIDLVKDWFQTVEDIKYVIVSNKYDYLDLWAMSLCKHNIISHSTFAWWGAYLNKNEDKIVMYPDDSLRIFWGELYSEPQNVERRYEHYKPEWIGMKVDTVYRI